MAEEVKKEEVKKKGPLDKIKELAEDKEEQMEIFSTFVRLGILICLLYTSPSPRDKRLSRMPSSA